MTQSIPKGPQDASARQDYRVAAEDVAWPKRAGARSVSTRAAAAVQRRLSRASCSQSCIFLGSFFIQFTVWEGPHAADLSPGGRQNAIPPMREDTSPIAAFVSLCSKRPIFMIIRVSLSVGQIVSDAPCIVIFLHLHYILCLSSNHSTAGCCFSIRNCEKSRIPTADLCLKSGKSALKPSNGTLII